MALCVTGPGAATVRLTAGWHHLAGLPEGSGCRIRALPDAEGAAVENTGSTDIHVEVLQDGSYQLADFLEAGKAGVIGGNSRLFVSVHQSTTTFEVACHLVMPSSTASPAAAPAAGSSKRPVPSGSAPGAGDSGGDDCGKRQRLASPSQQAGPSSGAADGAGTAAAAAAAGAGADPLDRVPDTPMHLMRVHGIPSWANEGFLGVGLADLVRGDMRWCLISNYMLDFAWLLSACPDLARAPRLLVVHGEHAGSNAARQIVQDVQAAGLQDRCTVFAPPLPIQFGTHHSKAFLIEYERGLRVIILTANAIYPDCNNKTQGLFWQDFPPKDEHSPKDKHSLRSSGFEVELWSYLEALKLRPRDALYCRDLLARHDFSAARAHIIASVPGKHTGADMHKWGHLRLRATLNREPPFPSAFRGAPLAAQYSSLGSLDDKWLTEEFKVSLAAGRCGGGNERLGLPAPGAAGLQLVWPSVSEVQNSIEGWKAGMSIPGPAKNVEKPFLQQYYRRWGGEPCARQRAMPHIKSFLRYTDSPSASGADAGGASTSSGAGSDKDSERQEVAWLYVGSHNLSKAAWGALQLKGTQFFIRSYELGVLLVPSLEAAYRASRWRGFSCTSTAEQPRGLAGAGAPQAPGPAPTVRFVPWQRGDSQEASLAPAAALGGDGEGTSAAGALHVLRVPLPIPFRLPPQQYERGERPWDWETNWPGLDSWGRVRQDPRGANYGYLEQMEWADLP